MEQIKTKIVQVEVPNGFDPMIVISQHEGIFITGAVGKIYSSDEYCLAMLNLCLLIGGKESEYISEAILKEKIETVFSRARLLLEKGRFDKTCLRL